MPTFETVGTESAGATCDECSAIDQPNNHVRNYRRVFQYGYLTLCTRCRNSQYSECHDCHDMHRTVDLYDGVNYSGLGHLFCSLHREYCEGCGSRVSYLSDDRCDECTWWCDGCGQSHSQSIESFFNENNDSSYCSNTMPPEPLGVRGYGRTRPTRWFGGPLPREGRKQVGFYLGFELEISSSSLDATPITRWESENGMSGFFDCKEDSSVEGFEIATQPFTPQFFETIVADGRLEDFFGMLNTAYPVHNNEESTSHGLHVHVGKVAFGRDPVALAAYSYLLGQDDGVHLERIARREPTGYCGRVSKPVSAAVVFATQQRMNRGIQGHRLYAAGHYPGRNAINLTSGDTVEVRAFASTRHAEELVDAVRLVYVGAEYVRYLRSGSKTRGVDPKRLGWSEFCKWAGYAYPDSFDSLVGLPSSKKVRSTVKPSTVVIDQFSSEDFEPEPVSEVVMPVAAGEWQIIDPGGCQNRNCCSHNFEWVVPSPVSGLAAILRDHPVHTTAVNTVSSPF